MYAQYVTFHAQLHYTQARKARKARRKMQVFYTNINNEKPPRITSSDPKFRRISF